MTIHLPPFLSLLGIVCGSVLAAMAAYVFVSVLVVCFMDTGEWGSFFHVARWPVSVIVLVLAGWGLSTLI